MAARAHPFVVLADASPQRSTPDPARLDGITSDDLDPLGAIGRAVRDLRTPPPAVTSSAPLTSTPRPRPGPVWPTGLAVNLALAVGALVLTTRRLRTPTRTLPRGQRVA